MEKKHIIIVVVVIVVWAGFMGYRHMKGKKGLETHHEQDYSRIIAMAKKSPRAGLAQMGSALKKYYMVNNTYPTTLEALYPKYMASKAFINEIKWNYVPAGDDFTLSKTVVRGSREMVASIDKGLRPRVGTGVMVAAKEEAPVEVSEAPGVSGDTAFMIAVLGPPPELTESDYIPGYIKDTGAQIDEIRKVSIAEPEILSVDEFINAPRDAATSISAIATETISVLDTEIASIVASDISQRYLVWKDKNGTIGFGNVNYPYSDNISITTRGNWYEVKRRLPEKPISAALDDTGKKIKSLDMIASNLSGWSLVWKNKKGVIGFGNVEFPDSDRISISTGDSWYNLKKRLAETGVRSQGSGIRDNLKELIAEKQGATTVEPAAFKEKETDKIASSLSGKYLVWKNDQGVLGFGNVGYPHTDRLSVNTGSGWDTVKKRSPETLDTAALEDTIGKKKKDADLIASSLSGRYLTWKDKHGVIGFGDVEYPELNNISYIHDNNTWQKVIN